MTTRLPAWFLELQKRGDAPSYQLDIFFQQKEGHAVAEKIRQLKLKDLKMVPHRPGYRGGDTYVCVDHLNEYLRRGNSLPYGATPYVEIFVNENQFAIRRAMGGHLENNCSDEEMAMIRALLEHHGVVVTSWLCSNHGDGMPGNIQKTGDSKQSFIDYLHSVAH